MCDKGQSAVAGPSAASEPTWRRLNRERLEVALAAEARERKLSARGIKSAATRLSKQPESRPRVVSREGRHGTKTGKKAAKVAARIGAVPRPADRKRALAGKKAAAAPRDEVATEGPAVRGVARRKGSRHGKALAALVR